MNSRSITKTSCARANLFAVLLLVTGAVSADSPGWVDNVEINYITVQPNGRIYLIIKTAVPDLNCSGSTFGHLEFDTDAPHFERQFAMVLAAHAARRKLRVYVQGCGHFPYVQNTWMY